MQHRSRKKDGDRQQRSGRSRHHRCPSRCKIKLVEALLEGTLDFVVTRIEELGSDQVLYRRSGELEMTVMRNGSAESGWLPTPGQRRHLKIPMSAVHLFEPASGRRIALPPTRIAAE